MIDPHESSTKILVVDDERLIRLTLSAKLKSVGYTPVAVASVDEAAAILKAQPGSFRAVITDIKQRPDERNLIHDGFDTPCKFCAKNQPGAVRLFEGMHFFVWKCGFEG